MSFYDEVYRESVHDWLDERDALAADERPDPTDGDGPHKPPTGEQAAAIREMFDSFGWNATRGGTNNDDIPF